MRVSRIDVVFQEVPGEIALAFSVTGCKLRCEGCHSPELWSEKNGDILSDQYYLHALDRYSGLASCVLFFGGEWEPDRLIWCLSQAVLKGFKTCLYTGEESISEALMEKLDFVKLGPWIASKGGLDQINTNQIYKNAKTGERLNHLFWR